MVVGVCMLELLIHNSSSLKAKRQALKSILGKVRSKFNLSIAEVGDQDLWRRAVVGFAVVSNDSGHAHAMMQSVTNYIENLYLAEIIQDKVEIIQFS
jgi:uncharacterized protein YlxP (DUF503 family)